MTNTYEPEPQHRMSIGGALDQALEHTKRMLFRPFELGVWIYIGVMAFLESLAQGSGGGGSFNFRMPGSGMGGRGGPGPQTTEVADAIREATAWIAENLAIIVPIASAVFLLMIGLTIFFQWLGSRAQMMLIRAVALNDPRLGENWRAVRESAHSLFLFRLAFAFITMLVSLGLLAGAAWRVIVAAQANAPGFLPFVYAAGPFLVLLFLGIILFAIINTLLRNLVAPLMYQFRLPAMAAWSHFRSISRGNIGPIILFLLVRIAYHVVAAIAGLIVGCVTCCVGILPVIHQSIFAPFYVFDRAFSLFVLESLGPEYAIVRPEAPPETYPPEYMPPLPPEHSDDGPGL